MKFTPENIEKLPILGVFVFGSNMNGNHAGGAAKTAVEKFGAIEGQAEGMQGESYAIPTLGKNMEKLPLEDISKSIDRLYQYADEYPHLEFYVTKLGLGIAGFKEKEIAALFKAKETPFNVVLPQEFSLIKGFKGFDKDMKCKDMQFEEGKSFHQDGNIECCNNGIHFCENPLDIHKYYRLHNSLLHHVEGEGRLDAKHRDSKLAVSDLRVGAKIEWFNAMKIGLDFSLKKVSFNAKAAERKWEEMSRRIAKRAEKKGVEVAQNCNALSARNYNALSAQNYNALSAQNCNALSAQNCNALSAQNYNALSAQDYNALSAQNENALSAENYNVIACRYNNIIELQGTNNIAAAANGSKIRGKVGNVICLVEFNGGKINHFKCAIIDGETIKEDVFYMLKDGELTEVE